MWPSTTPSAKILTAGVWNMPCVCLARSALAAGTHVARSSSGVSARAARKRTVSSPAAAISSSACTPLLPTYMSGSKTVVRPTGAATSCWKTPMPSLYCCTE